ncbi:MAG: response regulator transcription factor [Termitinemataceae bacterium]|nr:MAG: response regulator transcription factor [Termitinemataceae bacterium]
MIVSIKRKSQDGKDKPVILVVDDEEKISDVIVSYLQASGFTGISANNGRDALFLFKKHDVALVLLDLMLPDLSGESVCKKIRAAEPEGFASSVPIIMLTAKVDEASIVHGLNIGADDYITKPFSPKELVARVEAALRRNNVLNVKNESKEGGTESSTDNSNCLYCGNLVVDTDIRRVMCGNTEIILTPNEYKILVLLMSRPQKIFTREEIIECALGDDFDGFDRAVDTHIKNLRQKIGDDPKSPAYIKTVYGVGYKLQS